MCSTRSLASTSSEPGLGVGVCSNETCLPAVLAKSHNYCPSRLHLHGACTVGLRHHATLLLRVAEAAWSKLRFGTALFRLHICSLHGPLAGQTCTHSSDALCLLPARRQPQSASMTKSQLKAPPLAVVKAWQHLAPAWYRTHNAAGGQSLSRRLSCDAALWSSLGLLAPRLPGAWQPMGPLLAGLSQTRRPGHLLLPPRC